MSAWEKIKSNMYVRWLLILTAVFVVLTGLVWGSNQAIASISEGKFLKKTSMSGVDIGGLNRESAKEKLEKRIDFMNRRGFVYTSEAKTVIVYPTVAAIESTDTSYDLVAWDVDKSLGDVMDKQQNNGLSNLVNKLKVLIRGVDYPLTYYWDREQQKEILEENFFDVIISKQEADFEFSDAGIKIIKEQAGTTFDYNKALLDTRRHIEGLLNEDILLIEKKDEPKITSDSVTSFREQILGLKDDLLIKDSDSDWTVANDIWKRWLEVKEANGNYYLGINKEEFDTYISDNIKKEVEVPVQDAKFQLSDGRVSEFINSQEGREINIAATMAKLEDIIDDDKDLSLDLDVSVVKPAINNQEVNNLGIVDLLGTGVSDFAGSPPNRRHNIRVGVEALNGVLIAPDEEFSLIKALGDIDGENGYKQELVIKGGKTIPEFGGGLCQIGTTVFRGVLKSGLPVTARRNHSYRVPYYEPAGTDATIYDPWPDFRFKNDTGNHILLQTKMVGDKLYFEYWGTDDGRIAISTKPIVYNIVAPPPKKIIKTTDIPVGQEKCTERAHDGADAKFDYSVQYPGTDEPQEETFYSHYTPWQEVCLLGVTKEELLADQASSTDDSLDE